MKLFVYGTLKKGKGNHHMIDDCPFVGTAEVRGRLYVSGLPYMEPTASTDDQHWVKGEVYEVNKIQLSRLDKFEGHPDWYRRRTTVTKAGEKVYAYYIKAPKGAQEALNGEF